MYKILLDHPFKRWQSYFFLIPTTPVSNTVHKGASPRYVEIGHIYGIAKRVLKPWYLASWRLHISSFWGDKFEILIVFLCSEEKLPDTAASIIYLFHGDMYKCVLRRPWSSPTFCMYQHSVFRWRLKQVFCSRWNCTPGVGRDDQQPAQPAGSQVPSVNFLNIL